MLKRIAHDALCVIFVVVSCGALAFLWAGYMARIEMGLDPQNYHPVMEVP